MIIKCDNDCDLNIFKILVKYINDCSSTSDCLQVAEINIYIYIYITDQNRFKTNIYTKINS